MSPACPVSVSVPPRTDDAGAASRNLQPQARLQRASSPTHLRGERPPMELLPQKAWAYHIAQARHSELTSELIPQIPFRKYIFFLIIKVIF